MLLSARMVVTLDQQKLEAGVRMSLEVPVMLFLNLAPWMCSLYKNSLNAAFFELILYPIGG